MGRKHCGKRRNCSLRAISPFPTVFSKGLFPTGIKRCHCVGMVNSLPNDKVWNLSKMKAFADDKINVTKNLKFVLIRVENIVGKGENADYWHFLLFPQYFQKFTLSGSLNVGTGW